MNDRTAVWGTDELETEVKLGAPAELVLPDIGHSVPDLDLVAAPTLVLEAVYHDTVDLLLARNKVSLRHRTGEGSARWTLKLPKGPDEAPPEVQGPDGSLADPVHDGVLRRRELSIPSDDARAVPDSLLGLVTAWVRGAAVAPVVTLRSTRHRIELHLRATGEVVGEIADDSVEVIHDGSVVDHFREIEVEVTGSATSDVLPTITAALRYAGAGAPDPTSKVSRALGSRAGVPAPPLPVALDKRSTVAELTRASFTTGANALIWSDHLVRLDDDPAGVREAWQATRQLHADLRALRPFLLAPPVIHLRSELAWLLDQLSAVHDLDAINARLDLARAQLPAADQRAGRPLFERAGEARSSALAALVTSMSSPRYVELLALLVAGAIDPPLVPGQGSERARRAALLFVGRPVRKLRRQERVLGEQPTDADLLGLARRVTRARGAAELAAPVGSSAVRLLATVLAERQELIDELAAAFGAEAVLRSTAARFADHAISLVAGQLIAGQRADRGRLRASWADDRDALDQPAITDWLR